MKSRLMVVLFLLFGLAVYLFKIEILWFSHPSSSQYPIRILDVSRHQGTITWREVHEDGVRYAWIKATEGGDWVDPSFDRNRNEAQNAGILWGAYHFFTFCRPAADQAKNFLKTLSGTYGNLPPAVDIETGGNCKNGTPPENLSASLAEFLTLVETQTQRPTVIYVIEEQVPHLFEKLSLPDRPLWVRNLTREPALPDGRKATFWQYHARGWVHGIPAFVDRNAFMGSEADFEYFLRQKL